MKEKRLFHVCDKHQILRNNNNNNNETGLNKRSWKRLGNTQKNHRNKMWFYKITNYERKTILTGECKHWAIITSYILTYSLIWNSKGDQRKPGHFHGIKSPSFLSFFFKCKEFHSSNSPPTRSVLNATMLIDQFLTDYHCLMETCGVNRHC